ncbi:hypothetical protein [Caudoviricetes sp.]|nr:hypothetical protein [Caudoviricetes sp.]
MNRTRDHGACRINRCSQRSGCSLWAHRKRRLWVARRPLGRLRRPAIRHLTLRCRKHQRLQRKTVIHLCQLRIRLCRQSATCHQSFPVALQSRPLRH